MTQSTTEQTVISMRETANIRIHLHAPKDMRSAIKSVFQGEYESGYFGEGLTILDIGANVGSFTIWANLRWPNSTIYSYEAQPDTFQLLKKNVGTLKNVVCQHCAVFPTEKSTEHFWSRFPGDGEGGLTTYISRIFETLDSERVVEVPVLHPRQLPRSDIIKLDVEGAEAAILQAADIRETSLILLEYHDIESGEALKTLLAEHFILEYEDSTIWDVMLGDDPNYRRDLKGNRTGLMFFANKERNKLTRT